MRQPARIVGPAPSIALLIGNSIQSSRRTIGWSERELARRLGTNQAAIQRLEAGTQRHLDAQLATDALELLGIRLSIDARPPGAASRIEQRDLVHAWCGAYAIRRLENDGWIVRAEVEIGEGRFRGWIDLLAFRPADGALLCIEIKTRIDDLGRTMRTLGWYARSCRQAAIGLGWRPGAVVPVLMVLATTESEDRFASAAEILRIELPGRAQALQSFVDQPGGSAPPPSLALIDPGSRRRVWLIRTRSEGRRSAPPYQDYADAASRVGAGRRENRPEPISG